MPTTSEWACCDICRTSVWRYASGIQSLGSMRMSASMRSWKARSCGESSSSERSFFAPVSTICAYMACGLLVPPRAASTQLAPVGEKRYTFLMRAANSVSRSVAPAAARARHAAIDRWIQHELLRAPLKAKSLVVTVWGDAIAPHGGAVWLSGLIRLLAPLGLNERLVRTSVYRLAQEGWLDVEP